MRYGAVERENDSDGLAFRFCNISRRRRDISFVVVFAFVLRTRRLFFSFNFSTRDQFVRIIYIHVYINRFFISRFLFFRYI